MTMSPYRPAVVRHVRSVRGAHVAGKRVLVRADLNVPLEGGQVADDARIRAALPTLELLRDRGAASITVCSHLGRPKRPDPAFSLAPVEARLRALFDHPLTVLENTRFTGGETSNDPDFARALAHGQDLFVQDAFGSVHRAHASTVGVAELLPTYAGLLVEAELDHLGRLLGDVEHPFVIVCGGAKIEDKLPVLVHLAERADRVLAGGKLADQLRALPAFALPVELPIDVVAAPRFEAEAPAVTMHAEDVPHGWMALDIGRKTCAHYAEILRGAGTIFWNGPMGVFEWPRFAAGTKAVASAIATSAAYSVVGGGDSLRALDELGLADSVSWASTGGGAALELLEGKQLPGIAAIPEG